MFDCTWKTLAGRTYTSSIHLKSADWSKTAGGVYVFAIASENGKWDVLYVGECGTFNDRLCAHDRWDEAAKMGATHVHATVVADADERHALEQDMIERLHPPLNDHHNSLAEALLGTYPRPIPRR